MLGGDFIKIRKVLLCFLVVLLCFNGFVFSASADNNLSYDGEYYYDWYENCPFSCPTPQELIDFSNSELSSSVLYTHVSFACYKDRNGRTNVVWQCYGDDNSNSFTSFYADGIHFGLLPYGNSYPRLSYSGFYRGISNIVDTFGNVNACSDISMGEPVRPLIGSTVYLYSELPIELYDGSNVSTPAAFNYDFSVSDDYIGTLTVTTNSDIECKLGVGIYNQSSNEPSESTHIPYAPADKFSQSFNSIQSAEFSFDLQDFKDKCSDMKSFSDKIILSAWCYNYSENIYNEKFFYIDLNDPFTDDNPKKALFAEKKEYKSFPDLEDYLYSEDFPDIRDYVDFTMFDEVDSIGDYIVAIFQFLWSCLTGFFKWLWAVLKYIFFNFVGLFRWLGACLWTIIENIGIALYNLVVDLRRLVIYLFVPPSDELHYVIKDKFPSLARIQSYITAGKNGSQAETTVKLWGKEFDFNFSNIPKDLKSYIYTGSTICLYAIQIYVIIRCFFKMFGVQFGSSGGADD